jgi:uncharacterized cupredoxin-like copper-binding protein
MNRSRTLLLLSALTLAGLGAACGGGGDDDSKDAAPSDTKAAGQATAGGSTISVTAKEFSFEPKEIKLEAGKAATIALKNTGAVEHDITIDSPAFKLLAVPTKTGEAELTIPTAGSYTYYCSVPGHRQAGMEGPVTVS